MDDSASTEERGVSWGHSKTVSNNTLEMRGREGDHERVTFMERE
jgi:hypothetical protein